MPASAGDSFSRAEDLYNESFGAEGSREIEVLTEAVRLCPEDARFRVALGDAYMEPDTEARQSDAVRPKPRDPARALEVYREAVSACPDSPLPHFRLAEALRESDRPAVVRHLESAAALDPDNALPLYELALLAFQSGDDAGAHAHLEAARTRAEMHFPVLQPTDPIPPLGAICAVAAGDVAVGPQLVRLRSLAMRIAAAAGAHAVGPAHQERTVALIHDGELLADRVMRARPGRFLNLLVGAAIRKIIAKVVLPEGVASASHLRAQQEKLDRLPQGVRDALRAFTRKGIADAADLNAVRSPWEDQEAMVDRLLEEDDPGPGS